MRVTFKPIQSLKDGDIVKFVSNWELIKLVDHSSGFIDIHTDERISTGNCPDTLILCLVEHK